MPQRGRLRSPRADASLDQRFSYVGTERTGNNWDHNIGQGREFIYKYNSENTRSNPDGSPSGWTPDPDQFVAPAAGASPAAGRMPGQCLGDAFPVVESPVRDEDLPAFWSALGLPGIVDVHVHWMPDRLQQRVWEYFDSEAAPLLGVRWPVRYRMDADHRLALLRSFGVIAFTALLYPHRPGMAVSLNDWAADFAARTPGCLRTGTFFPESTAAAYVRRAVEDGTQLFKAHVQVGGYDPRDKLLDDVWGLLAEAAVPVVVHCGGGPVPTPFTGPGVFAEVMARHPGLPAIVAHLGMPEFTAFLDLVEQHPAMRLDTTTVFTDFSERSWPFPPAARPRLADLGDRILFGSDFPTIPYAYAHQVAALARLELGDQWLRAVLHDNAVALWPRLGTPQGGDHLAR